MLVNWISVLRAWLLWLILHASSCSIHPRSSATFSLNSENWTLTNLNGSVDVLAVVPGYVLEALRSTGVIHDPLYRYGELEQRWIADERWHLSRTFNMGRFHDQSSSDHVDLILEGIDTVADIRLNGHSLGPLHRNFHRHHRIQCTNYLRAGENLLNITIYSAIQAADAAQREYPYELPALKGPGMLGMWQFLRKPASDFGWDWGPAFAPSGLHGSVYLLSYSSTVLRGMHVWQDHSRAQGGNGSITLHIEAALLLSGVAESGTLLVTIPELHVTSSIQVHLPSSGAEEQHSWLSVGVDAAAVDLWWPRGYGGQRLYNLTLGYCSAFTACSPQRTLATDPSCCQILSRRIGFRQVELVMKPTDEGTGGETFYLRVNGVPVYAKGANVIPMSIVHTNVSASYMERLLSSALHANMNMLRVWGGGLYPRDQFYDFCDEHGIMVWQEAMMACAPYPRDPAFLADIKAEIQHQVRRLASHPSLVIFGGNNEVEASLDWFAATHENRALYAVDYVALFVEVVRSVLFELSPQLPFVDGSPTNGLIWRPAAGEFTPYVKRWGGVWDAQHGDVHFYNYAADCRDPETYPLAKFVSEFGFQSYPPFYTLASATAPQDWAVGANMTEFRQRHPNGTAELLAQMARHFELPPTWASHEPTQELRLFRYFLYLTQVQQALCYETALSRWRRGRSAPAGSGNMGVLYWQLNDIWQGASWSSISSDLRWKPLHYAVRRVYAPLLVTGVVVNGNLQVHLVNDDPLEVYSGQLLVEAVLWNTSQDDCVQTKDSAGGNSLAVPVKAPPGQSTMVLSRELAPLLQAWHCLPSTCYIVLHLLSPQHKHVHVRHGSHAKLGSQGQEAVEQLISSGEGLDNGCKAHVDGFIRSGCEPHVDGLEALDGMGGLAHASSDLPHSYVWLASFKESEMQQPGITVSDWAQVNATTISFVVAAQRPAALVVWETPIPGRFSDGLLVMHPCRPLMIEFYADQGVAMSDLADSLEISWLGSGGIVKFAEYRSLREQ